MAYIDKNIACDLLAKKALEEQQVDECAELTTQECLSIVRAIPTADVEEVKHGRWHTARKTKLSKTVQCTACDMDFYFKVKGQLNIDMCPRCPNCGAKMDGGKEE